MHLSAITLIAAALACSNSTDGTGDAGGSLDATNNDARDDGDCDRLTNAPFQAELNGQIRIVEGEVFRAGHRASSLFAEFWSAPRRPLRTAGPGSGECQIFTVEAAGFCDPICDGFCDAQSTCHPFPTPVDHGDIVVTGLKDALRFTYDGRGYTAQTPLQDSLFVPGDCVKASINGAVSLEGRAVGELDNVPASIDLSDNADYTLTWTPTGNGDVMLLAEVTNIHGSDGNILICESDDDGELTIAKELIAQFDYYEPAIGPRAGTVAVGRFHRTVSSSLELFVARLHAVDFRHPDPS